MAGMERIGKVMVLGTVLVMAAAALLPASGGDEPFSLVDVRAADVAWSPDGTALAYSVRSTEDWYYDLWTVDLLSMRYRCLTCSLALLHKHAGSPVWSPDGAFLVFTAENTDVLPMADASAVPGMGLNCNLWAMTPDGRSAWPLTRYGTDYGSPRGVLHPHFSHDGARLYWSEAVGDRGMAGEPGYTWGVWQLAVADFTVADGVPALKNLQHHLPGDRVAFYRSEGFAPGDRYLLLAGNPEKGQPLNGMDVYEYDLQTGRLARLTRTEGAWDDHPCYAPDGRRIYWSGGQGLEGAFPELEHPAWQKYRKSELWVMDRGGSNARAVTRFNQAGHPHQDWFARRVAPFKRVFVGDVGIDPTGARAAFTVFYEAPDGTVNSALLMMDLER